MEKKNLVYTIDNNYLVPFLVSTYSAKLQFGSNLKISIVQPIRAESGMGLSNMALDLCSSCLQYLEIDFEIVRVNTESYPEDKLPVWARFPKTTWLRYYYIYNGDFSGKYIHYVEADMLFTKNRPDIFEVELQGRAVASPVSGDPCRQR